MYKQLVKIVIDTIHDIWIGVFTGGFLNVILTKGKDKTGLIITLWASIMLVISGITKTLIEQQLED